MTLYHYVGAAPLAPSSRYVMLATPATSHPECNHERSMVATAETLARFGVQFDYHLVQGSCHVDDVRNGIIRNFLQWERPGNEPTALKRYTDLFFLDADMGWEGKSFLDILEAPGDIVAGVYRHKSDAETYPFHAGQFEGFGLNEHMMFEMPKVATGFMRIRRPVLEALYEAEKAKGRISWPGFEAEGANKLPIARIVERGWPRELGIPVETCPDNEYQSGDYVLCLKARALGFKVFADPDHRFSHAGPSIWIGHFGNHLRKEQGSYPPQLINGIEDLRAGKDGLHTFIMLHDGWDIISGRSPLGNPWTLIPEALKALWDEARAAKAPVLEMGSGLTTLVLGIALEGTGQVAHALESHLESWRATGKALEDFGISNVDLHLVPLEPLADDPDAVMYAEADLPEFGLALIDGPYHSPQRASAVWALKDRLRTAKLIIDDVDTSTALMTILGKAGHAIDIREGSRRWAVAVPPAAPDHAVPAEPMRHTLPGKLVVSLTSHPPRFGMLKQALESILNQDMRPDETVLWLARSEFAQLPSDILRMDGLTIRECEDIRSYKKLIPALEHYPGAFVLTADDDLIYPRTWVRGFVEAYRDDREILLRRGRDVAQGVTGALLPYTMWGMASPGVIGNEVFPTSCHGMFVPPGAPDGLKPLSPETTQRDLFMARCPMNDDIWWYWMGLRAGSTFRVIPGDPIRDLPTGQDGLWSQHNRDGGNDKQIAAMIEAYGMPWAKVLEPAE